MQQDGLNTGPSAELEEADGGGKKRERAPKTENSLSMMKCERGCDCHKSEQTFSVECPTLSEPALNAAAHEQSVGQSVTRRLCRRAALHHITDSKPNRQLHAIIRVNCPIFMSPADISRCSPKLILHNLNAQLNLSWWKLKLSFET